MKKNHFEEPKNVSKPMFTSFDILMSVGDEEFKKGKKMFDGGKVSRIESGFRGFNATVSGTHDYHVSVDANDFERGYCDCYVGRKDILCKHMVALAIAAVSKYRPDDVIIDSPVDQAVCSGEVRDITKEELSSIKKEITSALAHIKGYTGSSKTWFTYQDSLCKGRRLVLYALSNLPICKASADVCIDVIIKLDKKLLSSIDDSDGTIQELVEEIMELLSMFKSDVPALEAYIINKFPKKTNFEWENEIQHHF